MFRREPRGERGGKPFKAIPFCPVRRVLLREVRVQSVVSQSSCQGETGRFLSAAGVFADSFDSFYTCLVIKLFCFHFLNRLEWEPVATRVNVKMSSSIR